MRVTQSMLHPDLQPFYKRARLFSLLVKIKWLGTAFDWLGRKMLQNKPVEGMRCEEVMVTSSNDGWQIRTKIYKPLKQDGPLPLMLYYHGGGYLWGYPETSTRFIKEYIDTRPCIVVAPDYRKAYTKPFPAGFNDCYDTLLWAVANAERLGARSDNVILAGHSAGGGMTAAVTLKARDTGDVPIAFQMPIYPMIDDQQPNDPDRYIDAPVWDSHTNRIGWNAYLSDLHESGADIPAYAAPARNSDYQGFPPTITYIGTFDPFLEETRTYVNALKNAGVDVTYEEYDRCFHGFEAMLGETPIGNSMLTFGYQAYATFYDRYCGSNAEQITTRE